MISDLKREDSRILSRRVSHNIGKVAVQRYQDCAELLRLCNNNAIVGILRKVFSENEDFVTGLSERLDH